MRQADIPGTPDTPDTSDTSETDENNGWTRRFTAIGARLNEAIELYRGLGFEIRLEAAKPELDQLTDSAVCAECFVMTLAQTIYTRPLSSHTDCIAAER
jgi:hypothetical protein